MLSSIDSGKLFDVYDVGISFMTCYDGSEMQHENEAI